MLKFTRRVSCHDLRVENVESCRRKSLHLRESVEGTVSILGTTKPTNEVRRSLLGRGTYHITRCRRRDLWSHGWAVSFREARFSFFIIIQFGPLAIHEKNPTPTPKTSATSRRFFAGLQWCACLKWHSSAIKMTPFLAAARPTAVTMFFSSQRSQKWPLFYNKLGQLGHLSIEFDVSTGPSIWFLGPYFWGSSRCPLFFSNVQAGPPTKMCLFSPRISGT